MEGRRERGRTVELRSKWDKKETRKTDERIKSSELGNWNKVWELGSRERREARERTVILLMKLDKKENCNLAEGIE